MPYSFFEGPEKKVELRVVDGGPDLRALGRPFWEEVVAATKAQVISHVGNRHLDAYLLSESSLFVYADSAVMITCGRTRLIDGVARILDALGTDKIAALLYERKNEHFPQAQPTTFFDDARALATRLDGRALRFGAEHEHAVRLFHTGRPFDPPRNDRTVEILMHGIDPDVSERARHAEGTVAEAFGLGELLQGYVLDEYLFDPVGYSMNAIAEDAYATLHLTPEPIGSYVSFETNADHGARPGGLVDRVVTAFGPESFDVVLFEPRQMPAGLGRVPGYERRTHVIEHAAGYGVSFEHFYRPSSVPHRAFALEI
jgi:S-adenosylmethionine decarboxylase